MSKYEVNPGRGRRVWAFLLALVGIVVLVIGDRPSSRLAAAIVLLNAWDLAFLRSLPLNLTFGEIYQRARQGWRMSLASRIITYVTFGLTILAIYFGLHGR